MQWLRLEKPARSDVHVRVADSFDHSKLAQLPAECSLLAVSNIWGLCFIGDEKCNVVFRVSLVVADDDSQYSPQDLSARENRRASLAKSLYKSGRSRKERRARITPSMDKVSPSDHA
jgi:hypothetical protein